MKTRKLLRAAGLTALIVVALGGIAALAGRGSDETAGGAGHTGMVPEPATDVDIDVMGSIDRALRGEPATLQPNIAPMPPVAAESKGVAPAQRDSAANGTTASAPGGAPQTLASVDDRKIVHTASLKLQVKEVGGGFEEVGRIATAAGGFVASSNFSFQGEQQVAAVTIRVPAARYQDVLGQLRAIGQRVDAETSNGSDVTEEYSDLTARLRNLEATEGQLLQLLGRANTIADVLQVQDRLNAIRSQIEQVRGRIALLDKLSDMATISVGLRPVAATAKADTGGTDLGAQVDEAWDASLEFLGGIAGAVLTVVVFAWWLPLVALPAYGAWLRMRNRGTPAQALD